MFREDRDDHEVMFYRRANITQMEFMRARSIALKLIKLAREAGIEDPEMNELETILVRPTPGDKGADSDRPGR